MSIIDEMIAELNKNSEEFAQLVSKRVYEDPPDPNYVPGPPIPKYDPGPYDPFHSRHIPNFGRDD